MAEVETKYLQLDGAKICFEVAGSGPYIVFVPGANGDAGIFKPLRAQLTNYFTVVLYDRRGFSRSELTGEQDYTIRIDTDVDDIYHMMKSLTNEKFVIMGNSSGAVLSLRYLVTHPDTVSKCLIHEPPLLFVLPEKEELRKFQNDTYELYKKEGRAAAMVKFGDKYCNENDKKLMMISQGDQDEQRAKNSLYWFKHELRQYPLTEFDLEKVGSLKDKLILVCGVDNRGGFIYEPNAALAKYLDSDIFELSGGHLGFLTTSKTFAEGLVDKLKSEHII